MTEDPFVTHRGLLFTVAYEMLGSAADAEDVVQETWLRWAAADRTDVRDPRGYLVGVATPQALHPLTAFEGNYPVVGAWMVGDEAAGIGIREDRSRVTKNLSRFVPHAILG